VPTRTRTGFGGGSMGCQPGPGPGSEGVRWGPTRAGTGVRGGSMGANPGQDRVRRGVDGVPTRTRTGFGVCSIERRTKGARLPAGARLHHQPAGALLYQPASRGSASPPACRGPSPSRRRPPAYRAPSAGPAACRNRPRQTCAQQPRVAPLLRSKKPATLPTTTRVTPDRLDNPNRPVSILSNSEPALCALAPAPSH